MLQFIFTNVVMLAAGIILYLMARALPRIVDDPAGERPPTFFERLVNSDIPNRLDEATNFWLGKIFRRLKISLMRFDNYLTERLKRINTEASAKPKIDLADVARAEETPEEVEAETTTPLFQTPANGAVAASAAAGNGNGNGKTNGNGKKK
ncbi:MAG TPA: hypothetical protein VMC43_00935 [Candidatus Paceibacterota bacterium]|nr:hypothetical protein [Candidatus Paceibacterota bacterium]